MYRAWKRLTAFLICSVPGTVYAQGQDPGSAPVSSVINGQLPGWMRFSISQRVRGENITGETFQPLSDRYLLNLLQLNLTLQPVSWLSFAFQAQDARVFGQNTLPAPTSQKDAINLSTGYVQIGDDDVPVTLRAGRQSLDFGDGRLVSDQEWTNVGLSFDAARLTLRYASLTLDLFSGASVKVNPFGFDLPTPGEHFDGAYGSLRGIVPNASLEPYVFWRLEHNWWNAAGNVGNLDEKTIGLRWSGKLPAGFDYTSEIAGQTGSSAGDRIAAWMGHWEAGETLPHVPRPLRLFAEYNRASGAADPRDGVQRTFDPLFENPHDEYGLTDLFASSNLVHFRTGFQYGLRAKLTLSAAYNHYWLDSSRDRLYVRGVSVAQSATGAAGADVGSEPDVEARWSMSRSTQIIAGYGRLFPGQFLRRTTGGVPYNLVFLNWTQQF